MSQAGRPRRSLPERRRSGVEQRPRLVAGVRRVHPGRLAGGEDCTGPRGCRKVRRVVSRLKRGGRRGSGGDSPRPRRPLRSGGPVPRFPKGESGKPPRAAESRGKRGT